MTNHDEEHDLDLRPDDLGDDAHADLSLDRLEAPLPEPTAYRTDLEHLADVIARIDLLVAASCARTSREGRFARGRDIAVRAMQRANDRVPPVVQLLLDAADQRLAYIDARLALARRDGFEPALARLRRRFGLSQVEEDVLALVAAPAIDARYARAWQSVEPAAVKPDVKFAIHVLGRSFDESLALRRAFSTRAPLLAHSLLLVSCSAMGFSENDFLGVGLEVPRRIVSELVGDAAVSEELQAFSRLRTPQVPLDQVVLPADVKETVLSLVDHHDELLRKRAEWGLDEVVTYGRGLVLLFAGPPGTGKTMLANAVAQHLGQRLFAIDAAKLTEGARDVEANLDAVFREARLLDAVLFFDECEQIFTARRFGNEIMPMLLTRIEQFDGVAILATNMASSLDEALERRITAVVRFRPPTASARAEIWRKHLPDALPRAADVDVAALASDFELTGGYIKNAVLAAVSRVVAQGRAQVTQSDLVHGARLQLRVPDDVAQNLRRPRVALGDVVLAPDARRAVERIVGAAKVRSTVLSEWGLEARLPHGTGIACLFEGAPGTGKSMTAEAIAHALDRPLLLCNVPSVLSKWVGDTAKNLEDLFRSAREQRAVLVFDEADAIFAKRVPIRSSNDRFANADSAALLAMLERHEGVVILTTNLAAEIDPAFQRRLLVHVRFEAPDARGREAIWRALLAPPLPVARDGDAVELARAFEMTGREIKNAVLAAAFEAASSHGRVVGRDGLMRAAFEQAGAPGASQSERPADGGLAN